MDVKNSDSKILFVDAVRRLSTSERVWFAWTTNGRLLRTYYGLLLRCFFGRLGGYQSYDYDCLITSPTSGNKNTFGQRTFTASTLA